MKFGKMIAAVAAALTLSSSIALAQATSGWSTGRWSDIDQATVMVKGTMFDLRDQPMFGFQLRLHGREVGNVRGTICSLPRLGNVEYVIVGSYATTVDGRTFVSANILIDFGRLDLPAPIVVGKFDCVLEPNVRIRPIDPTPLSLNLPGATPWMPVVNGHVHGRWFFN